MSDDGRLTAQQIAALTGKSVRTIQIRATRENWPHIEVRGKGRGGAYRLYDVSGLPDEIQILAVTPSNPQHLPVPSPTPSHLPMPSVAVPLPARRVGHLTRSQRDKALAKYDLLRLYTERLAQAGFGDKAQVRDGFVAAYNMGLLYPDLYNRLGPVSWKTIEGWKRDVKAAGRDCLVLADNRGTWKRGATSIHPVHAKILLSCLLHPNQPHIAEAIRVARAIMHERGIENGFSDATYRRWVEQWRERNLHIWTYTREGWKAWNDTCALSAERDYDRIGVGDLVVADGHVLNFEIINPWTGKPKRMVLLLWVDMKSSYPLGWEIMPTENTQAIAAALRWAIIRLGKMPRIAYIDNGKAFGARFFEGQDLEHAGFTGLFERLGMQVIHARPYRGQSKTIERFFGTFSELERWAPTYTGTSIEAKPAGMMRGERLHRRLRGQMVGGGITLEQAHLAVAEWFDEYARRPQQAGHLKGLTPAEVFLEGRGPGVDRAQLADMMMATEIKSIRRSAIQFGGRQYFAPELHGRSHRVMIRYDWQDLRAIEVAELDGTPICTATQYDRLHPAAGHMGDAQDRQAVADHCQLHRSQERDAAQFARQFLQDEFLPAHREQMARIGVDTASQQPAIADQRPAAVARIPERTPMSDDEWARIQAQASATEVVECAVVDTIDLASVSAAVEVEEDAVALRARLEGLEEQARYVAIMEMEIRGRMVPERWRDFARYYECTLEYQQQRERIEERLGQLAVAWQSDRTGCVDG